ncbi:hypothetical protein [Burkholderia stagnalis]|uniref:hypothetical protein n=1 Tax=Burkholderia stagnalis TaxID=1503054 RepID=UPI0021AB8A5C|nr:hypothetical protein [Burkholderia stagnalis]
MRLHDARHRLARRARFVIDLRDARARGGQFGRSVADNAVVRAERQAHGVELFGEGKQEQVRFAPIAAGTPLVVLV